LNGSKKQAKKQATYGIPNTPPSYPEGNVCKVRAEAGEFPGGTGTEATVRPAAIAGRTFNVRPVRFGEIRPGQTVVTGLGQGLNVAFWYVRSWVRVPGWAAPLRGLQAIGLCPRTGCLAPQGTSLEAFEGAWAWVVEPGLPRPIRWAWAVRPPYVPRFRKAVPQGG